MLAAVLPAVLQPQSVRANLVPMSLVLAPSSVTRPPHRCAAHRKAKKHLTSHRHKPNKEARVKTVETPRIAGTNLL